MKNIKRFVGYLLFLVLFCFTFFSKARLINASTATCIYGSGVSCKITNRSDVECNYLGDSTWATSITFNTGSLIKDGLPYCPQFVYGYQIANSDTFYDINFSFTDDDPGTDFSMQKYSLTSHDGAYTKDSSPRSSTPPPTPGTHYENDDCEGIYGKFLDDLKAGLKAFKIIAPIMVAVYTTVEYLNAVTNKDADSLKKANNRLISRFILLLILFFLPDLVNIVLKLVGVESTSNCLK